MSVYVKIGKGIAVHTAKHGAGNTIEPRTECCGKLWNKIAREGSELTCKRGVVKAEKLADDRARLEYATRAAETQDEVMSQAEPETTTGSLPDHAQEGSVREALAVLTDVRLAKLSGETYAENRGATGFVVEPWSGDGVRVAWLDITADSDVPRISRRTRTNVATEDLEAAGWKITRREDGWTCLVRPADDAPDVFSDTMMETSADDAPYGAVDASLVDRETRERALYDGDAFELSTGRREPIADAPVTTWRMVDAKTGETIMPGTERESFRGETWRVSKIARTPEPGKEGRVRATDSRGWTRELYPSVFGLKIVQS